MTSSDSIDYKPAVQQHLQHKEDTLLHSTKRNRMSIKKEFPISKLLGKKEERYIYNSKLTHTC